MIPNQKSLIGLAVFVVGAACAPSGEETGAPGIAPSAGAPPQGYGRVVSLMPAATEILFALGAGDRLVGRTRWGVHPPAAREVPDVGDGMRPALEAVLARDPDLVVLYDGEANRGLAARLADLGVATLALEHDTLADLERSVLALGDAMGCPSGARELVARVRDGLQAVARATRDRHRPRVYYEAWADPPITIGRGSFIDSLISLGGADNVFGDVEGSAPRVSLEAIIHRDPDRILVAVPPDALDRDPGLVDRAGWSRVRAVSEGRVSRLDRDLVSRLGPRVADAAWHIARALHPDIEPPRLETRRPRCG